jgi:caffeoyl-CoA O-methyltransferase
MADNTSRLGASYATPEILAFLEARHAPMDAALRFAFEAPARGPIPAIHLGQHEASFLGWLLRLAGARKVVEVGTLAGFSGIHLARSIPSEGRLYTCEREPLHAAAAREAFAHAGLAERITVLEGSALESLATLADEGPFDAIFIDADKGNYDHYVTWAAAHLRPGGLLLGDNVFFFGRLLGDEPEAAAMRRFHEIAAAHFETCLLPTPDGLLLGRRK